MRCNDARNLASHLSKMSIPKRPHRGKVNVDYKARLEHKLYLARENPEPTFDITDCALKHVPSGIYSLCKVFRKRELLMNSNRLMSLSGGGALSDLSLLTILDVHGNELTQLSPDIVHLVSLKALYLQENCIKKLPEEVGELAKLEILNVSRNKLATLPETLGELKRLQRLDASHNRELERLPMSLGHARSLTELELAGTSIVYPCENVLSGGTIEIIAYLAKESGIKFTPEKITPPNKIQESYENECGTKDSEIQESRQSALLEVEKNIRERKEHEAELQSLLKIHKKKLLDDLAHQRTQLEREIEKVQQERDTNRARLISHIHNAERETDNVITEFLRENEEARQSQAELIEQENCEETRILKRCHSEQFKLRTSETLLAMEKFLEKEILTEKRIDEYTKFRDFNAQSLLTIDIMNNRHLTDVMRDQKRTQEDLVNRLKRDEILQRAAVAALLERSDARSWSIVQQVTLVQSQLAVLTSIELERKKLEINQQINDLADKRVTLTAILVNLLEQQQNRRKELSKTIQRIEEQRDVENSSCNSLFWLMRYQSLMEARPKGLLEGLEPSLVRHVAIAGALHCLPFLVTLPSLLEDLNDRSLENIGIRCAKDRAAVKLAVENYLMEREINECESPIYPSAPIDDDDCAGSDIYSPGIVRSISTAECVVCLDSRCEVIFLPCGHMCCCADCSSQVISECPMCRGLINHKVQAM